MKPLGAAAIGMLLVLVDLRLNGIDVVPDVIGWVVAGLAVRRLRDRHRGFAVAAVFAGVAAVLSLPPLEALPPDSLLTVAGSLADLGFAFSLCTGLLAIAQASDPRTARSADMIRWLEVAVSLLAVPLMLVGARMHPGAVAPGIEAWPVALLAVLLIVAGLATRVWLLVLMWSRQDRAYAAHGPS